MSKRIKVKGIRRTEFDRDALAFVFFTLAKRQVQERREREAKERDARKEATRER